MTDLVIRWADYCVGCHSLPLLPEERVKASGQLFHVNHPLQGLKLVFHHLDVIADSWRLCCTYVALLLTALEKAFSS